MKKLLLSLNLLSILVVLSLLLSACGQAEPTANEEPSPAAEETAAEEPESGAAEAEVPAPVADATYIRVMTFFAVDTPEVEEAVVAAFEEAHPDIKVNLEILPFSDYFTVLTTVIAGGAAPDVASMNYENLQQYAALGALADLSPFIEAEDYDMDQYYANTVKMHQYQGGQYGIPATFSTVPLFINTTLFDQAGLDYPDETWGWDDLIDAAGKLTADTDGDGVVDQFGYATAWWPMYLFLNGADFFDADGKCALTSPAAVEGLQEMADLHLEEGVSPSRADLETQSDWDMFIAGRLAMFPLGPWGIGPFQNDITDFEWDVAHHPAMAQRATFLFGNAYGIPKSSKNHEAAWEFVKFATGPKGGTIRQQGGYEISPVATVAETEFLASLEGKPPAHAQIFMDATAYAQLTPAHPRWNEMHDVIWPEVELALMGEQTMQEAMEIACPQVDAILAEN